MLEQDLRAEQDEDHTAGKLGLVLVAQAEYVAEPDAGRGKDEGDRADERHGRHDARAGQEREVMPTASASMLVAIASRSMVLNASEPSSLSSSFDSASRIMLPPMNAAARK